MIDKQGKLIKNKSPKCQIISWAFYDFATSAYFTVILTFVFATYFTENIAENNIVGTKLWGLTISASALLIAITSPILGAIADYGGKQKKWLMLFTLIGIISTSLLWFTSPNLSSVSLTLVCILISNFAIEVGAVFYNSFLPKISPKNYIGRISGWAYGLGYIGGIICLIVSLLVLIPNVQAVALLVGIWIFLFSLPLFLTVEDIDNNRLPINIAVKKGLIELLSTLKALPKQKALIVFLIARVLYIDGLNAVFSLGGIFAAGIFHLTLTQIMIFGVIINLTAGIGAALFAILDDFIGSKYTILISLFLLVINLLLLLNIEKVYIFWLVGPLIGIFVGPIQASSRTLLARLAKPNEITRMYGLYALSGKATSFLAPLLVGIVTAVTNSQRLGMSILLPFFIIGFILLLFVKEN